MSRATAGYLQDLCNRYGDFKVAIAGRKDDGRMYWTKHHTVMELWHDDDGLTFLQAANNRQILPAEIVLDLDDSPSEQRLKEICTVLDLLGCRWRAYFTGSRGFHVHVWDVELAKESHRQDIRRFLIKKLGCDCMKASDAVLIALEGAPHWKTGNPKTLVAQSRWFTDMEADP